jgi:hypothetical protein
VLWTPPEKLDANVQRMAWLLFMETWKVMMATPADSGWDTAESYEDCLRSARIVREHELAAGGQ